MKSINETKTLSTWQINFTPEEKIISQNIDLIETFERLFALGYHKITHKQFVKGISIYGIFLCTEISKEEIESVLFEIIDYCQIAHIADYNIFNLEKDLK